VGGQKGSARVGYNQTNVTDLADLRKRLAEITLAFDKRGHPVTTGDLEVAGAMCAWMRNAVNPALCSAPEAEAKARMFESDPRYDDYATMTVKTHLSLSHDPELKGVPKNWALPTHRWRARR
jgi:formyltetrahydrofolate synthetase